MTLLDSYGFHVTSLSTAFRARLAVAFSFSDNAFGRAQNGRPNAAMNNTMYTHRCLVPQLIYLSYRLFHFTARRSERSLLLPAPVLFWRPFTRTGREAQADRAAPEPDTPETCETGIYSINEGMNR